MTIVTAILKTRRTGRAAGLLLAGALLAACASGDSEVCAEDAARACVWAGTGEAGFNGDGHSRTNTALYWPQDLAFSLDGTPWVLDWNNHKVREVLDDGTLRTAVSLFHPTDIAFGPDGLIYIADWHNYRLTTLDPEIGLLRVLSGESAGFAGDGGPVEDALFNQPNSLAFGPDGALYVLDQLNQRIRRVSPDAGRSVDTVVGTGQAGFSGDLGPASVSQIHFESGPDANPSGAITFGPDGKLYLADALNFRIRRIDLEADSIETIAGSGEQGFSGDGGAALEARLGPVNDLEFGPDGRLYLADTDNNCVRAIDLVTGDITMVWNGNVPQGGEGGETVTLDHPGGIAFGPDGRLYIADTLNHRIIAVPASIASS